MRNTKIGNRFFLLICLAGMLLCAGCGNGRGKQTGVLQDDTESSEGTAVGIDSKDDAALEQGASGGDGSEDDAALTQATSAETDSEGDAALTQATVSETEDHVFCTWEAPLADGRTLTLEAVGRQVDEYSFGVREVRVYDKDTLLQTVLASEGGPWGEEYTNCYSQDAATEVLDLNFDGNMDFGLFGWTANNTIPFYYWTWDERQGCYRYAGTLQGVTLLSETEEAACSYRLEWGRYCTDYYQPNADGELFLARRETEDFTETSGNDERGVVEVWIPREGEVIPSTRDEVPADALVLIRRKIPAVEVQEDIITYFWEIWEWKDGELQMTDREED